MTSLCVIMMSSEKSETTDFHNMISTVMAPKLCQKVLSDIYCNFSRSFAILTFLLSAISHSLVWGEPFLTHQAQKKIILTEICPNFCFLFKVVDSSPISYCHRTKGIQPISIITDSIFFVVDRQIEDTENVG